MKIRADFVTNSSSSSFVTITITKKDEQSVVWEGSEGLPYSHYSIGGYYSSIDELYDVLVKGFVVPEDSEDDAERLLNQLMEIGDINSIESIMIEDSYIAWDSDIEDLTSWEEDYDEVEYEFEEDGQEIAHVVGTNIYSYKVNNGKITASPKKEKKKTQTENIDISCDTSWIEGKIFVHTGLDEDEEKDFESLIRENGGINKSSTVLNTDYLVCNPAYIKGGYKTTKLKRALELNDRGKDIKIITLQDFKKLLNTQDLKKVTRKKRDSGPFVIDGTVLKEYKDKKGALGDTVVIPDGITNIVSGAFAQCVYIKKMIIPASVVKIGQDAFSGCSGLESFDVEKGNKAYFSENNCIIRSKDKALVRGCRKSIIPDFVIEIDTRAFLNCHRLESIVIPDSVTAIGEKAFYECTGLRSLKIGSGVTKIGEKAFGDCKRLTSIAIPNNVKSIGEGVFLDCTGLRNVSIGDGVTDISQYAFLFCKSLENVTIGNSVISIGICAFRGCSSLENITVPNGVTSIDDWAFFGCESLTRITIPDSVTSIGRNSFECCKNLTIHGDAGSYAERYAKENDIPFVAE